MNLTIKMRKELAVAVLRDQFGDLIESARKDFTLAVNEKCKKDDGGVSEKIIEIAKSAGMEGRVGFTNTVRVYNIPDFYFCGFSYKDVEYSITDIVNLDGRYISRYSFWISVDDGDNISKSVAAAKNLLRKWDKTREDLIGVLSSVKTVKKLKEITNVFNPFIPEEVKGTALIPTEQLLRINQLKTPKKK